MYTLSPAMQHTFYFIGVTTDQSSIMKIFPRWAKEVFGLRDVQIKGINLPIHAPDEFYRDVVSFIRNDRLSDGALVTTHKLDLLAACRDLFDVLDPYAEKLDEISSISKMDGKLVGHAKDPISSGLALECFMPPDHWLNHPHAQALIMGAGGSCLAMSLYFTQTRHGLNIPEKIVITNRSMPRLESARRKLAAIETATRFEFFHNPMPADNDDTLSKLPPFSLVVNATGLGKDMPGSPITGRVPFPQNGLVWEINYRGEIDFLHQALQQKESRNLTIEDGWMYFIFGWTQVISEVFHLTIDEEMLNRCIAIANEERKNRRS
jgi:shikimate dehydrogenase